MAGESADYLAPEQRARIEIDAQLAACRWSVQDYKHATDEAARGVALCDLPAAAGLVCSRGVFGSVLEKVI